MPQFFRRKVTNTELKRRNAAVLQTFDEILAMPLVRDADSARATELLNADHASVVERELEVLAVLLGDATREFAECRADWSRWESATAEAVAKNRPDLARMLAARARESAEIEAHLSTAIRELEAMMKQGQQMLARFHESRASRGANDE